MHIHTSVNMDVSATNTACFCDIRSQKCVCICVHVHVCVCVHVTGVNNNMGAPSGSFLSYMYLIDIMVFHASIDYSKTILLLHQSGNIMYNVHVCTNCVRYLYWYMYIKYCKSYKCMVPGIYLRQPGCLCLCVCVWKHYF